MIRILLSLLLLEVCVGEVDKEHSNPRTSIKRSLSSDGEHLRRVVRDVAEQKVFGAEGNYVSTVIYVDVPPLSDSISVGFVSDKTDKFNILFNHVQFSKLSSAFALLYRIDLDASAVQLLLRLGKAHINGTYCWSATPSSPSDVYNNFELNLYAELVYTHNILFHIDDEGKLTFGKTENHRLLYKKVKGHYINNLPNALSEDGENYVSPKLLEAIVKKIHEEVSAKVSLDDVSLQIKSEISFRHRNHTADRLKKAIDSAFADVHFNCFNIFYYDKTNFNRIIQNFDVTIPTFVLRDVEKFIVHDLKISYTGEDVHAKGVFRISSPLAIMKVVYRNRNDPLAPNNTVKAEYHIWDSFYEFELIARPKTHTVEVGNVAVYITGASVASTQGLYGDERDSIIQQLTPFIKTFYPNNGYDAFASYISGLVDEGRIAHETFK